LVFYATEFVRCLRTLGGTLVYRYRTARRHMPILTLTVVATSYLNQRSVFVSFKQMHALKCIITLMRKMQRSQTIFPT